MTKHQTTGPATKKGNNMKSKVKQTSRGSWIFPDGISLPPAKFAKLMRDPRAKRQAASAQSRKLKKDLTMMHEYGIK